MFGKHVRQPLSGDTLRKMYTTMLGPMTITLKKKLHLAHHTMPSMMKDMGFVIFSMFFESLVCLTAFRVHADEVDAIGHWEGNTHCETCCKDPEITNLRQAPNINYGTVNFLELLQLLHGYFWWLLQWTKPLSPSKNYDRAKFSPVTASNTGCCVMSTAGADVFLAAEQRDASWYPFPPPTPQTGCDLIILSAEAFCDPITTSIPQFPQFTARSCSWSFIFEIVKQLSLLWTCWHPRSLGGYQTIKQLWAAWHEGTIIDSVRRQWSQFMFFITHINSMMDAGNYVLEAVQILDEQCGSMLVPQFHSKLQLKKKWVQMTAASTDTSPT
ncbi:hypothetical protein CY34DRAFT_111044 [Suillus luteus UH-Slu-Lm8-n1]|uniref:Uncharacterized protein n=1 Tax=Suillus luteus UH-Slu-Lm8-n1 TaxID=930992 RepID=A0A0D0AD95_9AGAM|nr:hypothetical protein CY34DRAFT_111044 [Suillus luteus UH-Slu-Lm8-n1]